MSCCTGRPTGPGSTPAGDVSIVNVGGGVELYRLTTGPNPFEFRTLVSTNSTVSIAQNANTVDITSNLSLANEGGSAEVFDTVNSTATLKLLRTLYSSDASVTVTQQATRINFQVPAAAAAKDYFESSTAIVTTNNTTYVTVWTSAAITGFLNGETWLAFVNCLICHPSGLTTVNTRIRWQIETSAAVFATMEDNINTNQPQTIGAGERSAPYGRFYNILSTMNTPRIRLQMSMSAFVATGGQVEYPRIYARKRSS